MTSFADVRASAPVIFDPRRVDEALAGFAARYLATVSDQADITNELLEFARLDMPVRPSLALTYSCLVASGVRPGAGLAEFSQRFAEVPSHVALGALLAEGTAVQAPAGPFEQPSLDLLVDAGLDVTAMNRVWQVTPRPSLDDAWRVLTLPATDTASLALASIGQEVVMACVDSYAESR